MTDRNELERLQPMTTEQKALALVKKARQFCTRITIGDEIARQMADELERAIECEQTAIEAHEADKKAFSDAMRVVQEYATWLHDGDGSPCGFISTADGRTVTFADFILPEPEPDPLVEAVQEVWAYAKDAEHMPELRAGQLRQALAARGYKIVPKEADNG